MKSQLAGKTSISGPIFSIVHTYLDIYSYQPEKNINEISLPTARTTLRFKHNLETPWCTKI